MRLFRVVSGIFNSIFGIIGNTTQTQTVTSQGIINKVKTYPVFNIDPSFVDVSIDVLLRPSGRRTVSKAIKESSVFNNLFFSHAYMDYLCEALRIFFACSYAAAEGNTDKQKQQYFHIKWGY